jgi:hypothetical protein
MASCSISKHFLESFSTNLKLFPIINIYNNKYYSIQKFIDLTSASSDKAIEIAIRFPSIFLIEIRCSKSVHRNFLFLTRT